MINQNLAKTIDQAIQADATKAAESVAKVTELKTLMASRVMLAMQDQHGGDKIPLESVIEISGTLIDGYMKDVREIIADQFVKESGATKSLAEAAAYHMPDDRVAEVVLNGGYLDAGVKAVSKALSPREALEKTQYVVSGNRE